MIVYAIIIWVSVYALFWYMLVTPPLNHVAAILCVIFLFLYSKKLKRERMVHGKLPQFRKSKKLTLLSDFIYTNPLMLLTWMIFLYVMSLK